MPRNRNKADKASLDLATKLWALQCPLKRLRARHGLRQTDLAAEAQMSRRTIENLEVGMHQPSEVTLRVIGIHFEVDWRGLGRQFAEWRSARPTVDNLTNTRLRSLMADAMLV